MDNHLIRFQKKKFLFLDFETFNVCLSDQFNLPWQAATILLEYGDGKNGRIKSKELSRHDLYLKWDTDLKISKEAKRITNYSESALKKNCIPEEEGFKIIYKQVKNTDYIVGHNVLGFDIYLLRNWFRKHGKNYDDLPYKVLDTFAVAKAIALGYRYKKNECGLLDFQMKMIRHHIHTMNETDQSGIKPIRTSREERIRNRDIVKRCQLAETRFPGNKI